MVVNDVLFDAFSTENVLNFCTNAENLMFFTKSPANITVDSVSAEKAAFQMLYLNPEQSLQVEKRSQTFLYDCAVFTLTEEEHAVFDVLPLPTNMPSAPPNFSELSSIMRLLYEIFYSADRYRPEKLELQLKNLIYCIAAGDDENAPLPESRSELRLRSLRILRTKMSDDPSQFSDVAQAAASIGLSVSRLEHLYQQYFSTSFTEDLIRARLRRASRLLQSTDWSNEEIARAVGYGTESNFYRQFKRSTGMTPSAFRKYKPLTV